MGAIHILYENPAWSEPLLAELRARGLPAVGWDVAQAHLDLSAAPPEGIFYSRMSASAHTRGHRYGPEYAGAVLAWLEGHGRRVLNGSRALQLELSKVAQYAALRAHGIRVPRTVAASGRAAALAAARGFEGPFIVKPNRGGKGVGVGLFADAEALTAHFDGPRYAAPVDGILLLQEYIRAPQPWITRVEFVGGDLLYAVRVDTSAGFELCPAEVCATPGSGGETFRILPRFDSPLVERYRRFLRANAIAVAGIEFVLDAEGRPFTYDVNTNTNYNPLAEARAGKSGLAAVAGLLQRALAENAERRYEAAIAG